MNELICWEDTTPRFRFVELFAGHAEATRMFRLAEFPSARLDLEYMEVGADGHENPMDLLSDCGMVILTINRYHRGLFRFPLDISNWCQLYIY